MGRSVFGLSRGGQWTRYEIPSSGISDSGAEGKVHRLTGRHRGTCIKEFLTPAGARSKYDKILEMVSSPISEDILNIKGEIAVIWPRELIFSSQGGGKGEFIGYSMRLAEATHPLDAAVMEVDSFSKSLSRYQRLQIARDVAALFVLCHKHSIIVCDARPGNLRVDHGQLLPWRVEMIDADSFQFGNDGKTFTGDMGDADYSSPRIQRETGGVNLGSLKGLKRTKADDDFALAVIIFQLLFLWHPFKNRRGIAIATNIKERAFSYENSSVEANKNAPLIEYRKLPQPLRQMFTRTFLNEDIVDARSWVRELVKAIEAQPKPAKAKPWAAKRPAPPPSPAATPPPPPPPPPKEEKKWGWAVAAAVVGGIIFLNADGEDDVVRETPVVVSPPPIVATEAVAELPSSSFFLVRNVNVRSRPSASGSSVIVGALDRGAEVEGYVSSYGDGRPWLRISSGQFRNRYISMVNMSELRRPAINTATSGEDVLIRSDSARETPEDDSSTSQNLDIGQKVLIAGTVQTDQTYAEITLQSGGVAYVPMDALAGGQSDGIRRRIAVDNRCPYKIHYALVWKDGSTWMNPASDGSYWDANPGQYLWQEHRGRNVYATSGEIYYLDLGKDFDRTPMRLSSISNDELLVNGEARKMNRVVWSMIDGGYNITFCS